MGKRPRVKCAGSSGSPARLLAAMLAREGPFWIHDGNVCVLLAGILASVGLGDPAGTPAWCWRSGKGKCRVHLLLTGYLAAACEESSLLRRVPCLAGHPGCHPSRPFRGISFSLLLAVLSDCYLGKSRPLLHVFRNVDARAQPGELSACVCLG